MQVCLIALGKSPGWAGLFLLNLESLGWKRREVRQWQPVLGFPEH